MGESGALKSPKLGGSCGNVFGGDVDSLLKPYYLIRSSNTLEGNGNRSELKRPVFPIGVPSKKIQSLIPGTPLAKSWEKFSGWHKGFS